MLSSIRFSVPLWPGLSPVEIERDLYPFLQKCGHVISDLYFTSRVAPFSQDAMGGIIIIEEVSTVLSNALIISEKFNIPLSATFNNINVSPSFDNYTKFVKNFRPLYDNGIRIVTIPNTAWLRFGLKQEYPDLFVKNTVLNRVQTASEVAMLFNEGFDYVNLDRTLLRDERTLKEITAAKISMQHKLQKSLYTSLLYNEMCEGNCPIHAEHYTYNLHRDINTPAYFNSPMSQISPCKIKDASSGLWILKSAGVPSYYSQLNRLANYVDVFKMHGRESKHVFYETLSIITQFVNREPIIDPYRVVLENIPENKKSNWLKAIRNCKFNCWKCTVCEDTLSITQST